MQSKTELAYAREVLAEVQATTGVTQPIAVRYPTPLEVIFQGMDPDTCNAAIDTDKTLIITEGLLKCFDREELKAVLAHELGHVANDDYERNTDPIEAEREADNFAGEHGFAQTSIRALSKAMVNFPIVNQANDSHPIASDRIKNFQRFLQPETK